MHTQSLTEGSATRPVVSKSTDLLLTVPATGAVDQSALPQAMRVLAMHSDYSRYAESCHRLRDTRGHTVFGCPAGTLSTLNASASGTVLPAPHSRCTCSKQVLEGHACYKQHSSAESRTQEQRRTRVHVEVAEGAPVLAQKVKVRCAHRRVIEADVIEAQVISEHKHDIRLP